MQLYQQLHKIVVYPSRDRENPQNVTLWDHSKFTIIVLQHMIENILESAQRLPTHNEIRNRRYDFGLTVD